MSEEGDGRWWRLAWIGLVVAAVLLAFTSAGRGVGRRFLDSLRIAKPQPVNALFSPPAGSTRRRRVQDLVERMLSSRISVTSEESDLPAVGADSASRLVGFPPSFVGARDTADITVTGARAVTLSVDRDQLRTILSQAGESNAVPTSLDGARVTIQTPRGLRVRYGHCPAPADTTIQAQFQRPPPPSPESRDCVELAEVPLSKATFPAGLDLPRLVNISLQVTGLSPNDAKAFLDLFPPTTALDLAVPRFIREQTVVTLDGARGLLLRTGGRRGPNWYLLWASGSATYTLSGYGSADDAVPLARSVRPAGSPS